MDIKDKSPEKQESSKEKALEELESFANNPGL